MARFHYLFTLLIIIFISQSCVKLSPYEGVAPGEWRAILYLEGKELPSKFEPRKRTEDFSYDEVSQGELPFNFKVIYDTDSTFYVEIYNGEEVIEVKDVIYWKNPRTGRDTIEIQFPHYESKIRALYEERFIEGVFIDEGRGNYSIPFLATHGQVYRFSTLKKAPKTDLTGKWEVVFNGEDPENSYKGIGEFKQNGNYLTGTFVTETGDYRFLGGTVQDDKMYLSVFDGHHAFLFEAKIQDNDNMFGGFWSGNHYKVTWTAKRNPEATLANPYDLTYLKEGYDKVSFSFPDFDGNMVALSDEKFQNKVKIVQILGTWCPNCADETAWLSAYYNEKQHPDLAIIGLAFEKHRDIDRAKIPIDRFRERFEVKYDLLFANGSSSKTEASEALPMLNKVISYPTMIVIDKEDKVRKIHTGFAGPATSQYEEFVSEFESFLEGLLAE
ncbi:MAG: TlpA disulfide reductase family protein [Bacteroidota bacterium]